MSSRNKSRSEAESVFYFYLALVVGRNGLVVLKLEFIGLGYIRRLVLQ